MSEKFAKIDINAEKNQQELNIFLCYKDEIRRGIKLLRISNSVVGNLFEDDNEVHEIVLIKDIHEDKFYALPAYCPFSKRSLEDGVLTPEHIRCAHHGSAYNLQTGELEDGPGFDSLVSYKVSLNEFDNKLYMVASIEQIRTHSRRSKMCKVADGKFNKGNLVVIGSGPAALTCIENLRKLGWDSEILMVTKESVLPYNRQLLSKKEIYGPKDAEIFRESEFYTQEIDVYSWLKTPVNSIDFEKKIYIHDNESEHPSEYLNLVLAMGSECKKLDVPGSDLEGIFYLRTWEDAMSIYDEQVEGMNVAIFGSELECYELASTILNIASKVTIIDPADMPLKILGDQFSQGLHQMFTEKNVEIHLNASVISFESDDKNRVKQVNLTQDTSINCNTVIICQGYKPATSFLDDKIINMSKDGHVIVDRWMQTNIKDVYAIGDIVEFPLWENIHGYPKTGERSVALPYWQLAQAQGKIVAEVITGKKHHRKLVPFFWTDILGKHITFCGDPTIEYEGYLTWGSLEVKDAGIYGNTTGDMVTYFFKDGVVAAVVNCGKSNTAVQFIEIFQRGIKVIIKDVEDNQSNDWSETLIKSDPLYDN